MLTLICPQIRNKRHISYRARFDLRLVFFCRMPTTVALYIFSGFLLKLKLKDFTPVVGNSRQKF